MTQPNITLSIKKNDNDYKLFCWLSGFSPKQIKVDWLRNKQPFDDNKILKLFSVTPNENAAMSQITIKAEDWNDGFEFTCQATHNSKIFSETLSKCTGQFCKNSMDNKNLL